MHSRGGTGRRVYIGTSGVFYPREGGTGIRGISENNNREDKAGGTEALSGEE